MKSVDNLLAKILRDLILTFCVSILAAQEFNTNNTTEIGSQLELFVDRYLIDKLSGVELFMHEPQRLPLAKSPLKGAYLTVIKDGEIYRGYYRDYRPDYNGPLGDGHSGEITCYAESRNGHEWEFPTLGIFDIQSPLGNNVILAGEPAGCSHNFSPFLDARPGKDRGKRFKALAGVHSKGGLYAFESEDGIHWTKMQNTPVITSKEFAFDSQNVSFWSQAEKVYLCFFRTWETPHGKLRTISRTSSTDFLHWSESVATNPNYPGEHLYTSQTHPYFRAPHIYIALPTRFQPDRGSSTDILFMTLRAGSASYARLFREAFIRPGLDRERWGNRSNYAALNVIPTGPEEMSIYHFSGHRSVLRTDGFVSARAGATEGELLTKTLTFSGSNLILNYSTSAAGSVQVEVQDSVGLPIPGFLLDDCPAIIGDEIEGRVEWKNKPDLGSLQGKPVRLRFVITEGDLYSFVFR